MNRYIKGGGGIFWAILILLIVYIPTLGQAGIYIDKDVVEIKFPGTITFFLDAKGEMEITNVKLHFGTLGHTCQQGGARQIIEFDAASDISVNWEWELKRSGSLPPGTEIWWQWEIEDQAGNQLLTERKTATVVDDRHEWQVVTEDIVTIQWYEGDLAFGKDLLVIAMNSLGQLENEMGVLPVDEIHLVVYPSLEEVREALIHTYEWTGGVAMPAYNSIIIGATDTQMEWAEEVITHELTHLVVGVLTFNCSGVQLPTWLNEGIAVFSENNFSSESLNRIVEALENDTLPMLETLESSFSAIPDEAALSYIQSGYIVEFLIQEFGQENFSKLLSTMQGGETIDNALMLVYGFETRDLDAAWRVSLGYDLTLEDVAGATSTATLVPTLALWTSIVEPTSTKVVLPTSTLTPSSSPPVISPSLTPSTRDINTYSSTPIPTEPIPDSGSSNSNTTIVLIFGILSSLAVLLMVYFYLRRKGNQK